MSCEGQSKISVKWTTISWGGVNDCSIGMGVIAMDAGGMKKVVTLAKVLKRWEVMRAFSANEMQLGI